jgi:hypothetical protein
VGFDDGSTDNGEVGVGSLRGELLG